MLRAWFTVLVLLFTATASGASLRFYGYGDNDIDRVKIRIDDPANIDDGPAADIGADDFTIEFWIRPTNGNNGSLSGCSSEADYTWICGNVIFDRDRFGQGRAFGISLGNGRVVFGVKNAANARRTISGTTDLRLVDKWYHIAVQRRTTGLMEIYVDGELEASATGPSGDMSYPNDGDPDNSACGGPCDDSDPFIVLGAEKHDVDNVNYPSYRGWFTELRLSNTRRYTSDFPVPTARFAIDGSTAALYHFVDDFGTNQIIDAVGNVSSGERRFDSSQSAGPEWSTESPFGATVPPSAGSVRLSQSALTTDEQNVTVTVVVQRTGGTSGNATIDYAVTGGSATAGADFDATSGTLTWADGDAANKSFTITIRADSDPEPNETINITLSNPTGAMLGTPSTAVLTITDNDSSGGGTPPPTTPPPSSPPPSNDSGGGGGGAFDPLLWCALLILLICCNRRKNQQFL